MDSLRTKLVLGAILGYAALARAAYLLVYRATDPLYGWLLHDARRYDAWAEAIASGGAWEAGAFYQAPLYPYLLGGLRALVDPGLGFVYVVQSAFGLLSILLIFRIGTRAYGAGSGLVAAGLAALYAPFAFYETKLLGTSLTVLLASLAVERMQAARTAPGWLVAGGCLGLTALASASFLLLAALGAAWLLVRHEARHAALLLAGALLLVGPVTARNLAAGGGFVPVCSNGGITFYQGNNPGSSGVFSNPPGFSGSIATQREEGRTLAEHETGRALTDAEISRHWLGRGIEFVTEDPGRWLRLEGHKALLALDHREHPLEYSPHVDANPARFAMPLGFAWVLALASVRLVAGGPLRRDEMPLLLLLATCLVVLLGFYVAGRYRMPAMPALLVLAGFGGVRLCCLVRDSPRRVAAALALALGVAAVSFLRLPLAEPSLIRHQDAVALADRALAYSKQGRNDRAIATYERALEREPGYVYAHLDLGKVLLAERRYDEALAHQEQALRLEPDLTEARLDMAVTLDAGGRTDEAARMLEARFRGAAEAPIGNALARLYLRAGRPADARRTIAALRRLELSLDPQLAAWEAGGRP